MMHARAWAWMRAWLSLALLCIATNAMYLPTSELQVDSLMPVTSTSHLIEHQPVRAERSIEGSGDDSDHQLIVIKPITGELVNVMERLEALPQRSQSSPVINYDDEGSGSGPEDDQHSPIIADINDSFVKEEGMDDVFKDLTKPSGLPTEDHNLQGNTLSVLASDDRPETQPEEQVNHASRIDEVEGSGESESKYDDFLNINATLIDDMNEDIDRGEHNTTFSKAEEIINAEERIPLRSIEETSTTENAKIEEAIPSTNTDLNINNDLSSTSNLNESEGNDLDTTTAETILEHKNVIEFSTVQYSAEALPVESTAQEDDSVPTSEPSISTDKNEDKDTSTPVPVEVELIDIQNNPLVLKPLSEAAMEDTSLAREHVVESSAPKSLTISLIIGATILTFIAFVVIVIMRKRSKRNRMNVQDNIPDPDSEKTLLGNGKLKQDNDEIKNNEITPLVINKFEKLPNFSSEKNLNTANEKNIEKDNVLKQAMIEDDAEEEKKAIEDDKKASNDTRGDESTNPELEKLVVRTHMDHDSIPRKPIIVTNGGHKYQAIPKQEFKT